MNYEEFNKGCFEEAKRLYKTANADQRCVLEKLFPELKESEDEKVREELIKHLKEGAEGYEPAGDSSDYQRWLAWVENQNHDGKKWIYEDVYLKEKEQLIQDGIDEVLENPQKYGLEKQGQQEEPQVYETEDGEVITYSESEGYGYKVVKPKFKCGDWLIFDENHNSVYQVERIDNYRYYLRHYLGGTLSVHFDNELIRLWNIDDAKDGDVLAGSYGTFILMGKSNGGYCGVLSDNTFIRSTGNNEWTEDLHPATKEQRDLLFKKMKEAGYKWDNSTKELKRIEEELQLKKGKYYKCIKSYHYLGCGEYWFDEGKVYFCEKDGYLRSDPYHLIKVDDCKNWQSYFCPYIENPVWKEEDEEMLKSVIATCELAEQERDSSPAKHLLEMQLNWLKSIKEKIIEL